MAAVTTNEANALVRTARNAQQVALRMIMDSEKTIGIVTRYAEVNAAAFGLGFVAARFGECDAQGHPTGEYKPFLGIPIEIIAGAALAGLAFSGAAGEYEDHLHNVADGCFALFSAKAGTLMGAQMHLSANAGDKQTYPNLPRNADGTYKPNDANGARGVFAGAVMPQPGGTTWGRYQRLGLTPAESHAWGGYNQ